MIKIIKKQNGLFDIVLDETVIGGGSMIVAETEEDFNYLERLDIDEEHRGQGHGTKALYELLDVYGGYYLTPDNENAKRLYEKVCDEINDTEYDKFGFAIDNGYGVYKF